MFKLIDAFVGRESPLGLLCLTLFPGLVPLHVIADAITATAYYSIPLSIIYFARNRSDLVYSWLFWITALFIWACGSTHWMDIWVLRYPHYEAQVAVKLFTALASAAAAIGFAMVVPRTLTLPSLADLRATLKSAQANHYLDAQRLRATYEHAFIGIGEVDRQGQFIRVNEHLCSITGYSRDELLGRSFLEITHPEDRDPARNLFCQQMRGERPVYSHQKRYVRKDGGVRWVELEASAVTDENGLPLYGIRIVRDVTERKRADAEVQQLRTAQLKAEAASEAQASFLAAMSHELRTPLTGVLGMVDILATEDLTSRQREDVTAIRASGQHLLNVVNDILDFSRIEAGKLELECIDFSMPALLAEVRSLVEPLVADRSLELRVELSECTPPFLRGDPTRIKQVLLNLVGNAIKFTEQGSVNLSVSHQPQNVHGVRLRFEVRDTGIGIAPDKQPELFNAFAQADRSTTRQFGGSGLGLVISKRLVEAMGGEIGVESIPGIGSLFWFEIPLQVGDSANTAGDARPEVEQAPPRRILIAEDVATNRDILKVMLSRQGHHVVFAENGAEAVNLAQRELFDLILMDVHMPVMDGVEATRQIRTLDGPARNIPILALTANVMAKERARYLAAGMNEGLMKPIDWKQLDGALAHYGGRQDAASRYSVQADCEIPLVDYETLECLADAMSADQLGSLLQRALDHGVRACGRMAALPKGADELVREAHSLRGAAGMVGLRKISELAAEIEAEKRVGQGQDLAAELRELVAATRQRLAASGWLPPEEAARTEPP